MAPLSKFLGTKGADANRNIVAHANALMCLGAESISNYAELILAFREKRLSRAAYFTRNLLELAIWTDYCSRSSANAYEFMQDTLRDTFGLICAFQRLIEAFPTAAKGTELNLISEATKSLDNVARTSGIESLDEHYTRVFEAANVLGPDSATVWKNLNSILSKFVHPTAFMVTTTFTPEMSDILVGGFLQMGSLVIKEGFAQIEKVHPLFLAD